MKIELGNTDKRNFQKEIWDKLSISHTTFKPIIYGQGVSET